MTQILGRGRGRAWRLGIWALWAGQVGIGGWSGQRDGVTAAADADKDQCISKEEFAQSLRSIGEPIFGQSAKNISGGKLLNQLFENTEKFSMQTQIQLLLLQKINLMVILP